MTCLLREAGFCFTHTLCCRNRRRETRCVPGSWLPSPGGEGEMPGVCLNIYHILVLVRLGERKVYREGMLFNRVHRGSMSLHLRGGLLTVPPLAQVASLPGLTLPPGGGPTPPRLSFPRFSTRWSRVPGRTIQLRLTFRDRKDVAGEGRRRGFKIFQYI